MMVRAVANARLNDRTATNIFQNMVEVDEETGVETITGLAPLECGTPTPTIFTVPSFAGVCLDATGEGDCDTPDDCPSPSDFNCHDHCCFPVVVVR